MIYQALYNVESMLTNSTNQGNLYTGLYTTPDFKLFDTQDVPVNVLSQILGAEITEQTPKFRLGIQAPPGTQFVLGSDNIFVIGTYGTFEIDENIRITSLKFIKPNIYEKDNVTSQQYIENGQNAINAAYEYYNNNVINNPNWDSKMENTQKFIQDFTAGKKTYEQGVRGMYKPNGKADLYNIIIDIRTIE